MVAVTIFGARRFAEVPENILPEFPLILLEGKENTCHKKVTVSN